MLEGKPTCAQQAGFGRKPLIASLPVSLHQSAAVLIPAALGTIGGLYSFFHGFSILQQQRPLPVSLPAKSTAHASKPVLEVSDTPKREPRTEIIQLTPGDASTSSVLMTQQGKIAAALLRAGIPSPATWTDESSKSSVRVAESPTEQSPLPSFEAKISVVLETGSSSFPTAESRRAQESAKRKAMVLIWGGPILTLACVYFLAAHLGWL
jgi:hypothetical protein